MEQKTSPPVAERSLRVIPWLVAMAFFMQMLDSTILNTAIPTIAKSLHASPLRMQSVVIAYLITVAMLIPTSGWLADRFGTKRVFIAAIAVFCLGSFLCVISGTLQQMVLSRIVQGVGGALMAPVGRLIVLRVFPRHQLVQVLSLITIPGMIGPLLGPAVGGILVQYVSWHWIFLINLPVGLVGGILAMKYLPEPEGTQSDPFDWLGFFLFGAAMAAITVAIEGMGELEIAWPLTLSVLACGLASLGGYCLHAWRTAHPLFALTVFKIRSFSVGIAGNFFARLGSGAMPFLLPLLLQVALGFSPAVAGLTMIPSSLCAIFSKLIVPGMIRRFGFRRILVINTVCLGSFIASFATIGADTPYWLIIVHLVLFGAVNSIQFTAMNTVTLIDLPTEHAAGGNSILSVVMQIAISFGVSFSALMLSLLVGPVDASHSRSPEVLAAFQTTFMLVGGGSILATLIFYLLPKKMAEPSPPADVSQPH
ncbi:MAG: multidrug transporter subunit MdtD [Desulfobulbus sp.]|jgi:EmrB/QacA subfamily drug resistance transporter|uniref:multidrug transporter subunit MdtD n=1 Tax=Desulfobulbus sp. TaxID=895 RepID=UPI00283EA870|nr:multidrug transporter subunit MdtD [Desulfobulbus sp.]MDR2549312.1 multidrug transporter subunit MdtD [Desulfobulbus sp.]